MHRSPVRRARTAVAACAVAVLALSLLPSSSATAARPDPTQATAVAGAPAGPAGPAITLADQAAFSGVDMATDPSTGTTYVAWIESNYATTTSRSIALCVLPEGANGCSKQIGSALGNSSAAGMHVVVTGPGTAALVWFYQADLTTGNLAMAPVTNGGLGSSTAVADAPSNGQLFDVVMGPDGQPWALTGSDSANYQHVQVRQGLTGVPQDLLAPWAVGHAQLGFSGGRPVVLVAQLGSISTPVHYASGVPWTGFAPIPRTWNLGVFADLVETKRGLRAITSEDDAGYRPVVSRWGSSGFGKPRLIGENKACPALTFDLVTDGSGRLANVSERCGKLGVYNLPDTKNTAVDYFGSGGTISGAPQIATTKRGLGWVAWSILSPTNLGNRLLVRPVRLPALMKEKSAGAQGNILTVRGPASCLPVVTIKASARAKPAKGWSVASRSLKLDGDAVDNPVKIDGQKLKEDSDHVLVGKAVFRKGGQQVTVTRRLGFRAC